MVKVGDIIKILPSAREACVPEYLIGKTAVCSLAENIPFYYAIFVTDKKGVVWGLRDIDFEPLLKVGDQLLFNFMTEEL